MSGFANTPAVALAAFDDNGRVLEVNATLARWLQREPAELLGRPIGQLMTPAGRVTFESFVLMPLLVRGEIEEVVLPLRPAQGPALQVMCSAARRQDAAGGVRNECAFVRVRQRLQTEASLLRVKRAAEHVPGVLFQLLRDGSGALSLSFGGKAAQAVFGLLPQHPARDAAAVLASIHPDDLGEVQRSLRQSAQGMTPWRADFRMVVDAQPTWRSVEAWPQRQGDGGVLWHGYASDSSSRRDVEAARVERDAAQRASHAKSEFMARASHELRTPLNGILGFAQLLSHQGSALSPPQQLQMLQHIEQAGRSLLSLINELLDIAGIEAGRLHVAVENVALAPLLQRCLALLESQARAAGIMLVAPPAVTATVRADAARLEQVLLNLLSNAVKYNRPGGQVSVSVQAAGNRCAVAVADTGMGLTPQQLAQLYQPFNRLGAERSGTQGTGLGLVIAKGLVEAMGGRLEVRSEPGQGSTFTLWLDAAPARARAQPAPSEATTQGGTV